MSVTDIICKTASQGLRWPDSGGETSEWRGLLCLSLFNEGHRVRSIAGQCYSLLTPTAPGTQTLLPSLATRGHCQPLLAPPPSLFSPPLPSCLLPSLYLFEFRDHLKLRKVADTVQITYYSLSYESKLLTQCPTIPKYFSGFSIRTFSYLTQHHHQSQEVITDALAPLHLQAPLRFVQLPQ